MGLDTSIITASRPVQFENPMDLQAKSLQLKQLGLSTDQAQLEANQQRTLSDLYRQNTNPDGTVNQEGILRGMASSGLGNKIPGYQQQMLAMRKGQADLEGTQAKTAETQFDTHKKRLDLIGGTLSSLVAKPDLTHDDAIAALNGLVDQGAITPEQGAQAARSLPGRPEQLRPFLVQQGLQTMDAAKRLEMLTPQYDEQDRGGVINQGTVNKLTGTRTEGANITKTMTPDQAAKVQMFGENQKPNLSTPAIDLAARRLLNGEKASVVLANLGRGKQGAADIAAVQNRFAELASSAEMDPTQIATRIQELGAEGRTRMELGAREGKIAPRVQEAQNFARIALAASAAVPRGNFLPFNQLKQLSDRQMNDPNLAKLKAATVSLVNAYASAVNGGGAGTVHDKEAAEAMLSTAQSPEAYAAVVNQLITETQAALDAPKQVMSDFRAHTTGKEAPAGATPPADRPPLSAFQK